MEPGPFGTPKSTVMEWYDNKDEQIHEKAKPGKKFQVLQVWNRLHEKQEFVRYWGSDYVSIFVNAGVHDAMFWLDEGNARSLRDFLNSYLLSLRIKKWRRSRGKFAMQNREMRDLEKRVEKAKLYKATLKCNRIRLRNWGVSKRHSVKEGVKRRK